MMHALVPFYRSDFDGTLVTMRWPPDDERELAEDRQALFLQVVYDSYAVRDGHIEVSDRDSREEERMYSPLPPRPCCAISEMSDQVMSN